MVENLQRLDSEQASWMIDKDQIKKRLMQSVWNDPHYYSQKGDDGPQHIGFSIIRKYCLSSTRLLDCGCGVGDVLPGMVDSSQARGYGIDISFLGVRTAHSIYPDHRFTNGDLEALPFQSYYFDAVYAYVVLEHLADPERVIDEMVRVTRPGGYVMFFSPNFGSPLHASPTTWETASLRRRFVRRMLLSWWWLLFPSDSLSWDPVEPWCLLKGHWERDWDTTTEPYVQTLIAYLRRREIRILEWATTFDSIDAEGAHTMLFVLKQMAYRLNRMGILPATFWGAKEVAFRLNRMGIPPATFWGENFYLVGQRLT